LGEVGLVGDFFGDRGWEKEIAGGGWNPHDCGDARVWR
jgi:hypothetical protein